MLLLNLLSFAFMLDIFLSDSDKIGIDTVRFGHFINSSRADIRHLLDSSRVIFLFMSYKN